MKVEMGESIVKTWLKHFKGCQIVQDNWKISKAWRLEHENLLVEIMDHFNDYYNNLLGLDIFDRKSDIHQILKQGEIDMFGVMIDDQKIRNLYVVEVAFHEGGLNYNKKGKTTESVILTKLVRTVCTVIGYFDVKNAEIIFATPKISKPKQYKMIESIQQLQDELNSKWDFDFKLDFFANEDFKTKIFDEVNNLSTDIADTSELYMRARQLQVLMEKIK